LSRSPSKNGTAKTAQQSEQPPGTHVIEPNAVYTLETARQAFGLKKSCLSREVRAGRLRVSKRAGRYFIFGRWLLEWLKAGEVVRKPKAATHEETASLAS
jgi:hypothetical protein